MAQSSPNPPWLDEILNDFSALGRAVYLDDPLLGLGHAALDDRDELGIPRFTPQTPRVPVALLERYQALWTHPDTPAAARKPGRPARCSAAWSASPTRRHAAPHADGRTSMITRRLRPAQAGG